MKVSCVAGVCKECWHLCGATPRYVGIHAGKIFDTQHIIYATIFFVPSEKECPIDSYLVPGYLIICSVLDPTWISIMCWCILRKLAAGRLCQSDVSIAKLFNICSAETSIGFVWKLVLFFHILRGLSRAVKHQINANMVRTRFLCWFVSIEIVLGICK